MEIQTILDVLFGIILAGGGWLVNNLWAQQRDTQKEVTELGRELARDYVPRAELQRTFDNLDRKLDDIQKLLRERQ